MQGVQTAVGGLDARSVAALTGGLAVGEVLPARVLTAAGDRVVIRLADRTLGATTTVPLEAGERVDLLVARASGGKLVLRIVGDASGKGADPGTAALGTAPTNPSLSTSDPDAAVSGSGKLPSGVVARTAGPSSVTIIGHGAHRAALVGSPATGSAATKAAGAAATTEPAVATVLDLASPKGGQNSGAQPGAVAQILPSSPASYDRLATVSHDLSAAGRSAEAGTTHVPNGGQGMTLPSAVAQGAARSDVAHLIADLGLPNDRLTTMLVAELVSRAAPLEPDVIRSLRRQLARLGGGSADARPLVLLSRIGLPPTPETLRLARQIADGAPAPDRAWAEALATLERLGAGPSSDRSAGLARQAIARWSPPADGDASAFATWLQQTLDETATPVEAKLARPGFERTDLDQDVRVGLDALQQAVANSSGESTRGARDGIDRLRTAVRSEQLANAAPAESTEPRYFSFTMPAVMPERHLTIELRVRERSSGLGRGARPDHLQLRLDLPKLGALRVDLTVGQPSLTCRFGTDTAATTALLNARAGELAASFRKLGYATPIVDAVPQTSLAPAPARAAGPPSGSLRRLDVRA